MILFTVITTAAYGRSRDLRSSSSTRHHCEPLSAELVIILFSDTNPTLSKIQYMQLCAFHQA